MRNRLWLLTLLFPLVSGCHLAHLAQNQYQVLRDSVSVSSALRDSSLTSAEREKIGLILEVRDFAVSQLWLDPTSNYSTFLPGKSQAPMYMLIVAEHDRLEPHWWRYPLIGRMTYRNYHDERLARRDEQLWHERGYDTYVGAASAYSTGGWFVDPIMPNMLEWDDVRLISTILHELTHATVKAWQDTEFNESAAEFVGHAGAREFVIKRYGPNSRQLQELEDSFHDEALYDAFFRQLSERARLTYDAKPADLEQTRTALFSQADGDYARYRHRFRTPGYRRSRLGEINNAILLLRLTYGNNEPFEDAFARCRGNWRQFIGLLKKVSVRREPFKRMRHLQSHL